MAFYLSVALIGALSTWPGNLGKGKGFSFHFKILEFGLKTSEIYASFYDFILPFVNQNLRVFPLI